MDDLVRSSFASPFLGEDSARPDKAEMLDVKTTIKVVQYVLGLPESGIGTITCLTEIGRDLSAKPDKHQDWQPWAAALELGQAEISANMGFGLVQDRQMFASTQSLVRTLFLTTLRRSRIVLLS
jgi:hypothetical protein